VARLVRAATPVAIPEAPDARESPLVAAPLTAGLLSPVVVLPTAWREWPGDRLRACLAHERAHVERRDTLVAFLAQINRALFWFHPLAWWLERALARSAEEAADEAAVRTTGDRRQYARALIDVADAVRRQGARVAWQGVAADGTGTVGRRIDRVLRAAPRELSRRRAAALYVACAAAVFAVAACRRDAPPPPPLQPNPEVTERLERQKQQQALYDEAKTFTRPVVDALEASLARNPGDLDTLAKLKMFYQVSGHAVLGWNEMVARRRPHILWLIEHHPAHELALWQVSPQFDPVTYGEAKQRWLAQASRPDASEQVLGHAALFLQQGDPPLAEPLLVRLNRPARLGQFYADVIVGPRSPRDGSPLTPFDSDPYAQDVRRRLLESRDAAMLAAAGMHLSTTYRDDARRQLGRKLLERAVQIDPNEPRARERLLAIELQERTRSLREKVAMRAAAIATGDQQAGTGRRIDVSAAEPRAVAELSEPERFALLPELSETAYMGAEWSGAQKKTDAEQAAYARSKQYAQDVLTLAPKFKDDPFYGSAVYRAHVVLGLHARREGDRAGAVRRMRDAVTAPPSRGFELRSFGGTDVRLVNYLLKDGERDTVAEFLEKSAALRPADRGRLLKDAADIRAGRMPLSFQSMQARG
jgi:hypothetical protein